MEQNQENEIVLDNSLEQQEGVATQENNNEPLGGITNLRSWLDDEPSGSLTSEDNNKSFNDNNNENEFFFELSEDDNKYEEQQEDNNFQVENNQENDDNPPVNTGRKSSFDYETISKEIGAEIKSDSELVAKFKEMQQQIHEANQRSVSAITNDKIQTWQSFTKLEDEALLKADLKAQGFSQDEIENAIDVYRDNGTMGIEATKIRKTLNRWIANEQNAIIETKNNEAKQQESEKIEMRKKILDTLNETETMFGFKIAKSTDDLPKVRQNHYKYITDKFLKDITKDEKSIVEASWLWRNKDTIINAIKNSGLQRGKKEVLDNIQNPDEVGLKRILNPSNKEFNSGSFINSL
jgi:hypothetical protein